MAKLILYGREMEVRATMPRIFVCDERDVEFLYHKADQISGSYSGLEPPGDQLVADAQLSIDLHKALLTDLMPPRPRAERAMFRRPWNAEETMHEIRLHVRWGIEQ